MTDLRSTAGTLWLLAKRTYAEWTKDKAMKLAAALALYTILSLAPLLVVTVKVLTVILQDGATGMVESQMAQLVGGAGADAIGQMIANTSQQSSGWLATIVSFCILMFSASYVFAELQDSMNVVWEVTPRPDITWWETIRNRFFSMAMVFGVVFLLLVSMFITAALGMLVERVAGDTRPRQVEPARVEQARVKGQATDLAAATQQASPAPRAKKEREPLTAAKMLSYVLDALATTLVVWLLFMLVFRYLPDAKIAWRDVWLGALLTAVLFKVGQYVLAAYFYFFSTTTAYGAAGSLVAVLLWAYYSSMILFFGAEYTKVHARHQGRRIEPEPDAVRLTDADRAERGIPRPEKVEEEVAEQDGRLAPIPARPAVLAQSATGKARSGKPNYLLAAGALGLGAAGAWVFSSRRRDRALRQAAALRLADRVHAVEEKVGRLSRLRDLARDVSVYNRVRDVQSRIRRARTVSRAADTGRPKWLVRVGDWLGGNGG